MPSNERKSEFLGMPFGTASQRLRKNILFMLLQRLGETKCFRCNDNILSVDDLSIEHKEPWEGLSVGLFWDLDNIAFSHLKCNRPHRYNPVHRADYSDGKVWCNRCKVRKERSRFHKSSITRSGTQTFCKDCRKANRR